ncbi:MAG: PEP-CTERM sorting domain-containing protein [Akkermansiaceae bacterium]
MKTIKLISASVLFGGIALSQAATVSWGAVGTGIQGGDLITDGNPYAAVNGGADNGGGGAVTIGDNVFTVGPINSAVAGTVSNTNNGGFYSPSSGNTSLDIIMDSHTYITAANPNGVGQIDIPVTPGNSYLVQFIGVGDDRGCCATREQFVDDGNGNMSGALTRGGGDWVVGSFTADGPLQSFFVTGETDPGLSGLIVRDLGAVPEPGTALLSLAGLVGLSLRRRR